MLACERIGSGEPLVLVHGIGHRRQAWYPVLDHLTEHREMILVDLPGHGDSPPLIIGDQPMPEALRSAFRAFLTEQGLDRPHVAGNSLGGRIALEAGASGDARSVTALSPAGFWKTDAEFAYTHRLFDVMSGLALRLEPRAGDLARTAAGRAVMYGWLTAHPGRITPEAAVGDFHAFCAAQPALRAIISQATPFDEPVPVPTTVAWSGRDLVLPRLQARRARRLLPEAHHLVLHGCGHVPMSDNPRLVAQVLLRGSAPVSLPSAA